MKYFQKAKYFTAFFSAYVILSLGFLSFLASPNSISADNAPSNISTANTCGMDISLVIDVSYSISADEMDLMKSALNSFVDAFASVDPRFSVVTFGPTAQIAQSFTPSADAVKTVINGLTTVNGGTNWQDALDKSFSTFDPRTTKGNLIILASDGDPNAYYDAQHQLQAGTGTTFTVPALAAAVTEADIIKASGTDILGLAIGADAMIDKFKQVAGPNVSPSPVPISNMTDIISTDFGNLSRDFASLYGSMCGSSIMVQSQIDTNNDGVADVTGDAANSLLAGYGFQTSGPTSSPLQSTDSTGFFQYINLAEGTYSLTETPNEGYSLKSIRCLKESALTGTADIANTRATNLVIAKGDNIYCTFLNASAAPTIGLNVAATPSSVPVTGGRVTFSYTVTNPNSFDLSAVNVADQQCSPVTYSSGDTNSDQILQNSETWRFTCSRTVTAAVAINATVSATYNGQSVTATGTTPVTVTPSGPPATGKAE